MRNTIVVFAFAAFMFAADAFAICQTCLNNNTIYAQCFTITNPEAVQYADFADCVETPVFDDEGNLSKEVCEGLPPRSDECVSPGGAGNNGQGRDNEHGGGDVCEYGDGGSCSAECSSCI